MNDKMISDWNKVVSNRDNVYCLGDFAMAGKKSIMEILAIIDQLNGTIYLVFGNHDDRAMWQAIAALRPGKVILLGDMAEIKVDGQYIVMCHYSMRTWNRSHYGAWQLFGHSHNTLEGHGKSMDVGVDAKYATLYNWAPFSFDEIKAIMETKEHNTDGREI